MTDRIRDAVDFIASVSGRLCLWVYTIISEFFVRRESGASESDIDVVITWVNGDDPVHRYRSKKALAKMNRTKISKTSKAKRRFSDNEELKYCLRSIYNHAPWVRRIWLVTDLQFPSYLRFWKALSSGIVVVSHKQIFSGKEKNLPTFNSLSIESMLWRIPGLTENFIYFNDDTFLAGKVNKSEFFGDKVIVRGRRREIGELYKAKPHFKHQVNAFRILGLSEDYFFSPAHFAYTLKKSVMKKLFYKYSEDFNSNIKYRFRNDKQFWPIALSYYYMIDSGMAELKTPKDGIVLSVSKCKRLSGEELEDLISQAENGSIKFLCVNFMEMAEEKIPDVRLRLDDMCGDAAPFEK